jgi:alkylated DNA repair dioxygenase AlkB
MNGEDGECAYGGVNYTKKMNPANWVYQTQDVKALDDVTSNSDFEEDDIMGDDEPLPAAEKHHKKSKFQFGSGASSHGQATGAAGGPRPPRPGQQASGATTASSNNN